MTRWRVGALDFLRQLDELPFVTRQSLPSAPTTALESLHQRNQVLIPYAFHFIDRQVSGLFVLLARDPVDQRVVHLRHIHQLRPRPFQAGTELGQEMTHSCLAAGHSILIEDPHLRVA